MLTIADITSLTVSLDIDGQTSLFILLDRDGTMNRMGSGSANNTEDQMVIGPVAADALDYALEPLEAKWLERTGTFQMPDPQGLPCELTLMVAGDDDAQTYTFRYGDASLGVPSPFRTVVERAVEVTQKPYEQGRQ